MKQDFEISINQLYYHKGMRNAERININIHSTVSGAIHLLPTEAVFLGSKEQTSITVLSMCFAKSPATSGARTEKAKK